MSEKKVWTEKEIEDQLAEAKRCKTFLDILNGRTPSVIGVTSEFLDGALNVSLSAAIRLGEIVKQLQESLAASERERDEARNLHAKVCMKYAEAITDRTA